MTFETTLTMLRGCTPDPLASRCLEGMENSVIIFHPGFQSTKEYLAELYTQRLRMTRELGLGNHAEEDLRSWGSALGLLSLCESTNVHLHWLWSEGWNYLLFSEPGEGRLISMFAIRDRRTFEEHCKLNDHYIERGLSVNAVVFDSGNRIRDWVKR